MKSITCFILVNCCLLLGVQSILACYSPSYHPAYYYTFRLYDNSQPSYSLEDVNCSLWQEITDKNIPLNDIRELIYEWSYEHIESWYKSNDLYEYNEFADWIALHNDGEIKDFILLAKTCEYVRWKQTDPWYYSSEGDDVITSLEKVAKNALAYKGERLKERYMLQAIRALFSLYRYDDCINLWNEQIKDWNDGLMKQMITPYIAGCFYRIGNREEADKLSVKSDEPNEKEVQRIIHDLEKDEGDYFYSYRDGKQYYKWNQLYPKWQDCTELYETVVELSQKKGMKEQAAWSYTAAYLADKLGKPEEALHYIHQAQQQPCNDYLQSSIRVLAFYLEAKYLPINSNYEQCLLRHLQWMEKKIYTHLDKDVEGRIYHSIWSLNNGYSIYYWNDMLRKTLLSVVAPRYEQMGNWVRAIQVTNVADNMLFHKISQKFSIRTVVDMMRDSYVIENEFDYQSYLFKLIEDVEIKEVIAYTKCLQQPVSAFDYYCYQNSYTDPDYFNDIIGTKLLRNNNYKEAVDYLGKVSMEFQFKLNTSLFMKYNPFQSDALLTDRGDYKLNFAREMCSLEQQIKETKDPNRKAQYMIRYAIGKHNSNNRCWALTRYYISVYDIDYANFDKEDDYIQKALSLFTNQELKARAYWQLGYYKKVMSEFSNTAMASYARAHCDNLRDYVSNRYR